MKSQKSTSCPHSHLRQLNGIVSRKELTIWTATHHPSVSLSLRSSHTEIHLWYNFLRMWGKLWCLVRFPLLYIYYLYVVNCNIMSQCISMGEKCHCLIFILYSSQESCNSCVNTFRDRECTVLQVSLFPLWVVQSYTF